MHFSYMYNVMTLSVDVAVRVVTHELVSSMLNPCFDVAIESMSQHISKMVSGREICCGCLIAVATLILCFASFN